MKELWALQRQIKILGRGDFVWTKTLSGKPFSLGDLDYRLTDESMSYLLSIEPIHWQVTDTLESMNRFHQAIGQVDKLIVSTGRHFCLEAGNTELRQALITVQ